MKIIRDKSLVEFKPENEQETSELQQLWNLIVDCAKFNKKLVPVGEYIPENNNAARFYIEGGIEEEKIVAQSDCTVICFTCNTEEQLKKGDPIPMCCGKLMEID
jgi:hypothetical protein